jgi:hypothetical protein
MRPPAEQTGDAACAHGQQQRMGPRTAAERYPRDGPQRPRRNEVVDVDERPGDHGGHHRPAPGAAVKRSRHGARE